jgi:hypothetical protein
MERFGTVVETVKTRDWGCGTVDISVGHYAGGSEAPFLRSSGRVVVEDADGNRRPVIGVIDLELTSGDMCRALAAGLLEVADRVDRARKR